MLARKSNWTQAGLDGLLPPIWRCIVVMPTAAVRVSDDPDEAAGAGFIVTGNDDLLRLRRFGQTKIVTPRRLAGRDTHLGRH